MSGVQTLVLPDLGEGLTEAEVVRWLVAVGDEVAVDQPVVEVETAKSIVEVPSPYAGKVSELHGAEGATVDVGRPLISVAANPGEPHREEVRAGSGNVLIGYGTQESSGVTRRRRPRGTSDLAGPHGDTGRALSASVPRVTSPLVRKLARDAGLPVRTIEGTGPGGLIRRSDVQAAIDAAADAVETEPSAVERAAPARAGLEVSRRVPMGGFRKAVAASLSRSRSEIPEATVWVDVDFTELFGVRSSTKAKGKPTPSLLAYLARFTVLGLRAYPELNGEVDVARNELVQYEGINLGIAIQADRGLMVPAIPDAHRLTTIELCNEIRRITESARAGRATADELTSGTFTLNNYGPYNVDGSAAIINYPQVAILGFGRVIDRPWVVDGEITVRKIGQMSLVFDHRVCDGSTAAGFMRVVADAIESPASAVADL
jgi:pyruvate dehydrogenase E2 component (dihydrolipoamide acetyltransferase)